MVYLKSFRLPTPAAEDSYFFRFGGKKERTFYTSYYPFKLFYYRNMPLLEFEPVTILYGGNGSGKSTILNLIAKKLGLKRESVYNRSDFFEDYAELCECEYSRLPPDSKSISSDDVFDYVLNIRCMNEGVEQHRAELYNEYWAEKARMAREKEVYKLKSLDDYQNLKRAVEINRRSESQYIGRNSAENLRERSNGESAFLYFTEAIADNSLYLLDEPENSMSPNTQLQLMSFLEESARFFGCQLVIATHSPFLLSMKGARIYDLDDEAPCTKRWTELDNVKAYYSFFMEHKNEF